jgi:hypothetical protein
MMECATRRWTFLCAVIVTLGTLVRSRGLQSGRNNGRFQFQISFIPKRTSPSPITESFDELD